MHGRGQFALNGHFYPANCLVKLTFLPGNLPFDNNRYITADSCRRFMFTVMFRFYEVYTGVWITERYIRSEQQSARTTCHHGKSAQNRLFSAIIS